MAINEYFLNSLGMVYNKSSKLFYLLTCENRGENMMHFYIQVQNKTSDTFQTDLVHSL